MSKKCRLRSTHSHKARMCTGRRTLCAPNAVGTVGSYMYGSRSSLERQRPVSSLSSLGKLLLLAAQALSLVGATMLAVAVATLSFAPGMRLAQQSPALAVHSSRSACMMFEPGTMQWLADAAPVLLPPDEGAAQAAVAAAEDPGLFDLYAPLGCCCHTACIPP